MPAGEGGGRARGRDLALPQGRAPEAARGGGSLERLDRDDERQPTTLRVRMVAALAVLVLSVALSGAFALSAQRTSKRVLDEIVAADDGIAAVLRLSIALRDAYAHQAHVVILNDLSHLGHYQSSHRAAEQALRDARARIDPGEHGVLEKIGEVVSALDRNFKEEIAPRIPGEPSSVAAPHDRALELLMDGQRHVDELAARLVARADAAQVRAQEARTQAAVRLASVLLGALLLALLVAVYMDRSIAGPLRALELASRRLGQGELSTRIDVRRDDELGALARRFNRMAEELAARERRLLDAERLAGIGKVAAGVAHEINNPLSVILGYARLIEKQGGSAAADAAIIVDEVGRCREIVAGLLDLSRTPKLSRSLVDLEELAKDVVARLRSAGADLEARFSVSGETTVEADEGKVRQIVTNLLQNAVDAAPGAPASVAIQGDAARVVLSVQDEGPGVPEDARAKLFEPFFTTKPKGTGLGLAVSAALARAHGGRLAHVDPAPSRGARFLLELPRSAPAEVSS